MPTKWLSYFSRFAAGTLLFQSTAPLALAVKNEIDVATALGRAFARASAPPSPMKGVPTMRAVRGLSGQGIDMPVPQTSREPDTILDETARRYAVPGKKPTGPWRTELREPNLSAERRAWLNLWLGESRLAAEEPDDAEGYLACARRLGRGSRIEGIAAYDLAAAKFYEGYFALAGHEFRALLKSGTKGFVPSRAGYFARHADACLGYHRQHEALGITQPPRLDPLCGVSGITVALRSMGLPHDKAMMLRAVPHHGMGSTAQDIVEGARRLGLNGRIVGAEEKTLRALPKPLIAHVEHDHFVAVVDADRSGVEYVCSDCGPWPGGPIRLSWKQWRAMEADAFVAVTKPGSPEDLALAAVLKGVSASDYGRSAQRGDVNLASVIATKRLLARYEAPAQTVANPGGGGGTSPGGGTTPPWMLPYAFPLQCGSTFDALACNCDVTPPTDAPKAMGLGPSLGDPVNLATGEEEYAPSPDITVYNPKGPSVSWGRSLNTMQWYTGGSTYYGSRWTTGYSLTVEMVQDSSGNTVGCNLVEPNNAKVRFTIPSGASAPSASNPSVNLTSAPGIRLKMLWKWDSALSDYYFEIVYPDRSRIVTTAYSMYHYGRGNYLGHGANIDRIYDPVGNYIQFHYSHTNVDYLMSIDDSDGVPLLTLGYDPNATGFGTGGTARLVSLNDRYGRSVYYGTTSFGNGSSNFDVSQIVSTGTSNPPIRYRYGIVQGPGVDTTYPNLQSISVPSPTGSGLSTSTINYDGSTGYVSSIVDGNGNRREYAQGKDASGNLLANHTLVTVKDPAGNVAQRYTVGFDAHMNQTELINGQGQLVWSKTFGSSMTPSKPSSSSDGNGRALSRTYDQFGNVLTETTPKGTTTTYTYDYTNFSLGELTSVRQGSKTATTYTYYEPSGLVHEVFKPIPGQSGSAATQATTFWYDAIGNPTQIAIPGNNAVAAHMVYYGYTTDTAVAGDPSGSGYTQPERLGKPITITDALGKVTHIRYDQRGNLVSNTDALGNQTLYAYNLANQKTATAFPPTGNTGSGRAMGVNTYLYSGGPITLNAVQNEAGTTVRTTAYTYGSEGETLSSSGSAQAVSTTYDAAYQPKTLKDGANNATAYTYDLSGRTIQIAYPGTTGTNYDKVRFTSYDAVGNLLSRTDGNGQITNYAYGDTDGHLSAVSYPGTTGNDVSLTYDAYDQAASRTDGAGSYAWRYDDLGNRTGEDTSYTGISTQTVSFAYWPDGSRKTLTLPAGRAYGYTYDADGRCTGMSLYASTTGPSFAYYDNGREASRTMPNGLTTTYGYNAVGSLTGLVNTVGSATVSQYGSFAYDGVFNPTSLAASVPSATAHSGTTTYGYDAKDRLTSESSTRLGGYSQTNAYDAADSPTTLRGAASVFNADNQRTGTGYVFDGNGAPTTYNGVAQTYDVEGRLKTRPGWSAVYRADGLRGWKDWQGGSRKYYLYVDGKSWMEVNSTSQPDAINVWGPDGLVGRRQGASWEYYAYDPQGNVAQRTDGTGAVLSSSVYDGYGSETYTGTRSEIFGYNGRWGYVADRETGLYYCQNRYYDPTKAMWITRDPMGQTAGLNTYSYCGQSPVMGADPSGLYTVYPPNGGGVGFEIPLGPRPFPRPNKWRPLTPEKCAEAEALLRKSQRDLDYELAVYDKLRDDLGSGMFPGFPLPGEPGGWHPGGHYEEIENLIRSIQNALDDLYFRCPPPPGPPDCSSAVPVDSPDGSPGSSPITGFSPIDGPIGFPGLRPFPIEPGFGGFGLEPFPIFGI